MPTLIVPAPGPDAERMAVTIWDDVVEVACGDAASDAWLGDFLGRSVRLVAMDAQSERPMASDLATKGGEVSFADAYPFLAISQGSLDALNSRLAAPISMQRFRPNLVISGCDAHAEDDWDRLRIGGVDFEAAQACTRCVFTTVDPVLGTRDVSGEPLRTLKTYRRTEKGITFGMHWFARNRGVIHVGDRVEAF